MGVVELFSKGELDRTSARLRTLRACHPILKSNLDSARTSDSRAPYRSVAGLVAPAWDSDCVFSSGNHHTARCANQLAEEVDELVEAVVTPCP